MNDLNLPTTAEDAVKPWNPHKDLLDSILKKLESMKKGNVYTTQVGYNRALEDITKYIKELK